MPIGTLILKENILNKQSLVSLRMKQLRNITVFEQGQKDDYYIY